MDSVSEVSKSSWRLMHVDESLEGPNGYAAFELEWLDTSIKFLHGSLDVPGVVIEDVVRTLIADILLDPEVVEPELDAIEEACNHFRRYLRRLRDGPETDRLLDDQEFLQVNRYFQALAKVADRRRYFRTKARRIGMCHHSVQPGDIVCDFKTAAVPYVLRPTSRIGEFGEEVFTLVGDAYVHGIMKGEAFTVAEQEGIQERLFTVA